MADLINFNKARKQHARKARAAEATSNRVLFGRSKQEKQAEAAVVAAAEQKLDGIKRESHPKED